MKGIKNIIFDFGGVIINIEYERISRTFHSYGLKDFDRIYSKISQTTLFNDFEKGLIDPPRFRNELREISGVNLSDEEIDNAWNAILIDLPKAHIDLLLGLKKSYRIFLLSNTNAIHEKAFMEIIHRDYGENILDKVFERVYFSHHLKKRKPDAEIFIHVLKENDLAAAETLFVDDSIQHIEGAFNAGLQTMLVEKGITISSYFS